MSQSSISSICQSLPPLRIVRIPDEMNPFAGDKVELRAALACDLPLHNIKLLTVYGLLESARTQGKLERVHTLIDATSGNTGIALAKLATKAPYNIKNIELVIAPDVPPMKQLSLKLAGATIRYPNPNENFSPVMLARKLGGGGWNFDPGKWQPDNGVFCLDQYANPANAILHRIFTAPNCLKQVKDMSVFVAGLGTTGTALGASQCFRPKSNIAIVGVACALDDPTPGVRTVARLAEVGLPLRTAIDALVEVGSKISYLAAVWLGLLLRTEVPGPSSGFAYVGALQFLRDMKIAGRLDEFRNAHGKIVCVIIFPDSAERYYDQYEKKLAGYDLRSPTSLPLPWTLISQSET
jgi:cysteine synthase